MRLAPTPPQDDAEWLWDRHLIGEGHKRGTHLELGHAVLLQRGRKGREERDSLNRVIFHITIPSGDETRKCALSIQRLV